MNGKSEIKLKSDEIRRQMRRRRRESPIWGVCSFVFHVLLFVVIVLCTPAKQLFKPEEKKASDAAKDLSADRIEQISDNLSKIRVNELLEQLEQLQAVLHNMDMMKEQLQKDYDEFAASMQQGPTLEETKKRLAKVIDDVETNQVMAIDGNAVVRSVVSNMAALEGDDIKDKAVNDKLRQVVGQMEGAAEKMTTFHGNAQNLLDLVQSDAAFAGLGKTSAAAEKLRDAQIEVARMQNGAQNEASGIAWKLSGYSNNIGWFNGEKRSLEGAKRSKAAQETSLKNARLALKDAEERFAEDSRDAERAQKEFDALDAEEKDLKAKLDEARKALDEARRAK